MATKHCCWGICKSDSRYPERMPSGTTFIRFAKPGKIREHMTDWEKQKANQQTVAAKRWMHACGRKDFSKLEQITKDTYICSLHFINGKGPTENNPDPILASLTEKEQEGRLKRRKPPRKRDECPLLTKKARTEVDSSLAGDQELFNVESSEATFEQPCDDVSEGELVFNTSNAVHQGTQTVYDKYMLGAQIETMILRNKTTISQSGGTNIQLDTMSPELILQDQKKAKYFIGLYPGQFEILLDFLGPAKFNLQYWYGNRKSEKNGVGVERVAGSKPGQNGSFTIREELFITLLRLRRGFALKTIAYIYNVSESVVSRIFNTWIQFMFLQFKEMKYMMFPSRKILKPVLPKVFRSFRNIRCSIDCTEFFVQTPRNYSQQGNVYSSYKHHTTFKALIAVTPNGAACFVSDLYEGSIDDVSITKKCGIIDHIEHGDVVLVDKGFTIQDLLNPKHASIKIPAFLGKRERLTKEEEMDTRRIAKARIHVERFNERLKKFKLIGNLIPLSLSHIASQMVYVACCLVNFQPALCT